MNGVLDRIKERFLAISISEIVVALLFGVLTVVLVSAIPEDVTKEDSARISSSITDK